MSHQHALADDAYRPRDPHHQATPSGSLHDPHTPGSPGAHGEGEHGHTGHVVPLWLLAGILGILLVLTVLTVAVTYVDLGALNIWIALGIAALKGALVALYFMHLRWDSTFNTMAFITALIFLALFIGVSLLDSNQYKSTFESTGAPQVTADPATGGQEP